MRAPEPTAALAAALAGNGVLRSLWLGSNSAADAGAHPTCARHDELVAAEARQTSLAEAEDYDAAEEMTATIEALESAHAEAASRLEGVGAERTAAAAALEAERRRRPRVDD